MTSTFALATVYSVFYALRRTVQRDNFLLWEYSWKTDWKSAGIK